MTDVVEGELISDAEFARRSPGLAARARVASSDVVTVARVTRRAVTHDYTRAVAREVVYIPGGVVVAFRWWQANCTGVGYAKAIREAEVRGDWEAAERMRARADDERHRRYERIIGYIKAPQELLKALVVIALVGVGGLLTLGVAAALAFGDPSLVVGPFKAVMWCVATVVWLCTVGGTLLVGGGCALVVLCLWAAGRRAGMAPDILVTPAARDASQRDLIPDEGAILNALRDLNLPALNRKLKEGWRPRWVLPTERDGRGYRTQLELPPGVTVGMIADRRPVLAHNLVRLPVEVWPTEPQRQPGVLDLWVADQGLLTGPVPPHPLLTEGVCDFFKGVPVGFDQRGDLVIGRLMASNYAIGGTMGSGKTSLVINLLVGAMLDPLVDLDIFAMAYNVDFDPFTPRARVLVKGDEDEHITAAMDGLSDLREEVTQRGKLLAEMGGEETKLTRAIAKQDARMRPRVVVFDECQELFRHERYGEQAKQLAIKVMTKARKTGLPTLWVTPEPSADSLPRELAKVVSHRVCFAIGDHQGNDAILGTGAYKRGISAVDLDPSENIGTAMASGFGARPGLLRTCYIRKDRTTDELSPIVHRSLEPWKRTTPAEPGEVRDLVLDVHEALGEDDKVRAADMPRRLREMAPTYLPYQQLTGEDLARRLSDDGVEVKKEKGYLLVRAERVLRVLDMRQGVE